MNYFKAILRAENLPSWISLLAIIVVLFTLDSELSRNEIERKKLEIVTDFTESTLPITFDDLKSNPKKLQAMSELVSDKLAVQTARGYESNRFDPRLKDDIYLSVRLALAKQQVGENKFFFPSSCKDIKSVVADAKLMVINFERLRGGDVDSKFEEYLKNHRDVFLKQLIYNTDRNGQDFALSIECFKPDI